MEGKYINFPQRIFYFKNHRRQPFNISRQKNFPKKCFLNVFFVTSYRVSNKTCRWRDDLNILCDNFPWWANEFFFSTFRLVSHISCSMFSGQPWNFFSLFSTFSWSSLLSTVGWPSCSTTAYTFTLYTTSDSIPWQTKINH